MEEENNGAKGKEQGTEGKRKRIGEIIMLEEKERERWKIRVLGKRSDANAKTNKGRKLKGR